jgi:hypothetical protein
LTTVTADADRDTVVGNDLSALVRYVRRAWQAIGYYHMPFQLTIQCSNAQCS